MTKYYGNATEEVPYQKVIRMTLYFSKDTVILNYVWNSPRFIYSYIFIWEMHNVYL